MESILFELLLLWLATDASLISELGLEKYSCCALRIGLRFTDMEVLLKLRPTGGSPRLLLTLGKFRVDSNFTLFKVVFSMTFFGLIACFTIFGRLAVESTF